MPESLLIPLPELPETLTLQWHAFHESLSATNPEAAVFEDQLKVVWLGSQYAAEQLQKTPSILTQLIDGGVAESAHSRAALSARIDADFSDSPVDESGLMQRLRQVRHRENIRIIWRDLNGLADTWETLEAASALASELIDRALDWQYSKLTGEMGRPLDSGGEPQRLAVLGMGKLGGGELNFSSDIDLIFAFPENGQTDHAKPKDNAMFFTRLGQRLIASLNKVTADGFVYRVDMRLRPFGDSGALVMNFDAMESYYEAHGREWERYAMLKAAPVAGDLEAGEALLQRLSGFIYRRYLDYGVLEHLREMKAMIARQAYAKGAENNIKLGPGGIREIEFSTQVFQLISGGRDKNLQVRSLRDALEYIGSTGMLEKGDVDDMLASYEYLRKVENRLQMLADHQTQLLPQTDEAQWRLAAMMGHANWADFSEELAAYRAMALEHFNGIFSEHGGDSNEDELHLGVEIWRYAVEDCAMPIPDDASVPDFVEDMIGKMLEFTSGVKKLGISQLGMQRLDRLMPLLMPELMSADEPLLATERVLKLLKSVARRPVYFSMLSEHPQALAQLVSLCESSEWIAEQLIRFPALLDEVLDPLERQEPLTKEGLNAALELEFSRIDVTDEEAVLNLFRHFKNRQVLRVAATDILGVFPVMKVSDHLTWIAEVLLEKALEVAAEKLIEKHGKPRCVVDDEVFYPQIGLVAYGKLGGIELGYGSDLDIVFFHNSHGAKQYTDGDKSLDNSTFFARLIQRLVNIMTVFTSAGSVYEIDLRLRPSGNSGLLVTTVDGFRKYQEEKAWTWEHQALVRARYICGPDSLNEAFAEVRGDILCRQRDQAALRAEVREMREKMWAEHGVLNGDDFNLKKSPGGITDIEFMVQYMVLAHAAEHPALCRWTDNVRILQSLAEVGILDAERATILEECYRAFRDEIHHLKLKGLSSNVSGDRFVQQREFVKQCWESILGE